MFTSGMIYSSSVFILLLFYLFFIFLIASVKRSLFFCFFRGGGYGTTNTAVQFHVLVHRFYLFLDGLLLEKSVFYVSISAIELRARGKMN